MRIKEIKIEGLFDMFTHTIKLNETERLSIVYGINGIGKTMIFKILDSLFNLSIGKILSLIKSPFHLLTITYEDDTILVVENKDEKLKISVNTNMGQKLSYKFSREDILKDDNLDTNLLSNYLRRDFGLTNFSMSSDRLMLRETNEILELEQVLERYEEYLPMITSKLIPTELKDILNKTSLYFIQTQRLIIFRPKKTRTREEGSLGIEDSVSQYSKEIAEIIQSKRSERDKLLNDLQNSFNKRILDNAVDTDYSVKRLNEASSKIEARIEELKEVGLIEKVQFDNLQLEDVIDNLKRAILSVNIQDMNKTLAVFDDLYTKFQKFIEILNKRRLSFKQIAITDKGFVFTNDKGKILNANDLSSGEQHELVLLYLLLFKIPENALILIDEPEISLHITWQKAFLNDMEDIIKLRNFDILIATHSPAIINGNWDLTTNLDLTLNLQSNGTTV